MELYIVRHAQSTNNVLEGQGVDRHDYLIRRSIDPPLTELGARQAERIAGHLAAGVNGDRLLEANGSRPGDGYGITHLYCSPMQRSLQTAAPVSAALGLRAVVWVDIHEQGGLFIDHPDGTQGTSAGKTRREIAAEFPDYHLPEAVTDQGWWRGGYEDMPAAYGRAIKVAAELLARASNPAERILLVSHGTFIDALLKALFNQLPSRGHHYAHYNTAITRLDFREGGKLVVRYQNRVEHLPPELLSW